MTRLLLPIAIVFLFFTACSPAQKIGRSAQRTVLNDSALLTAHVGISVYDAERGKYLYNYQGDKYFVPASNVKIPTCYAAMKYLGDSLVGLRYSVTNDSVLSVQATGDPTFLHKDFKEQKVFRLLKTFRYIGFCDPLFEEDFLGSGWSWNDHGEAYMAQRSQMPVYGNLIEIRKVNEDSVVVMPKTFRYNIHIAEEMLKGFSVVKFWDENNYHLFNGSFQNKAVPFRPHSYTIEKILEDTLGNNIGRFQTESMNGKQLAFRLVKQNFHFINLKLPYTFPNFWKTLHSQPTDSLLKPMMHRSDNFFAEQSLLMVSNEVLGVMSDEKIIDSILKTDFADLPQKPRWADGSGLSRYNLFTPQDMVAILNKMRLQFGMARIKEIFPTGNEGTLTNYYKSSSGHLFAKTGTLSGVVALSGFLYTRKNKLLLFSVLVNNHQASGTAVRRAVEKFVEGLRNEY